MIKSNKALTEQILEEALSNIRGAITIVWPMGLPEWEPVRDILDDKEDLTGTQVFRRLGCYEFIMGSDIEDPFE